MWLDKSVRDKKNENDLHRFGNGFRYGRGDGMKIRIEIDENLKEEEVVIRSRTLDVRVQSIHAAVDDAVSSQRKMTFYKGETEYYLPLSEMLFSRRTEPRFLPIQRQILTRLSTVYTNWRKFFRDIL